MNKIFVIFIWVNFIFNALVSYHLEKKEISSHLLNGFYNRPDIVNFFNEQKTHLHKEIVVIDPLVLQAAAKTALGYFKSKNKNNIKLVKPRFFEQKLNSNDVRKTLEYIVTLIEQDKKRGTNFRILNPKFLEKNFKFIKWSEDNLSAYKNKVKIPEDLNYGKIPKGQIRLTNYAVFVVEGSNCKTSKCNCPIYSIINKDFENKDRFKFTKQNILAGVLEKPEYCNKVKPLVWISRNDLESALMQGGIYVKMPNGKKRYFNVYMNNGFVYDKKIKDIKKQKRYWYFKEIKNLKDSGSYLNFGGVLFAGDIFNLGLGKIIAIKYKNRKNQKDEIRLGVLLDSGSALTNNLYQLDLFAGVFDNKKKFKDWLWGIPNTVEAYILVKK
ncbi:hypothetical protein GF322_04105 [Candidatus Dependentiae bacterium]|nr:hypothetical protein [Candidatus Dependentiae bacterium]